MLSVEAVHDRSSRSLLTTLTPSEVGTEGAVVSGGVPPGATAMSAVWTRWSPGLTEDWKPPDGVRRGLLDERH